MSRSTICCTTNAAFSTGERVVAGLGEREQQACKVTLEGVVDRSSCLGEFGVGTVDQVLPRMAQFGRQDQVRPRVDQQGAVDDRCDVVGCAFAKDEFRHIPNSLRP